MWSVHSGVAGAYMTYRKTQIGYHLQLKHKQQLLKMCLQLYRGLNFESHNVAPPNVWSRLDWILIAVTIEPSRQLRNTIFWFIHNFTSVCRRANVSLKLQCHSQIRACTTNQALINKIREKKNILLHSCSVDKKLFDSMPNAVLTELCKLFERRPTWRLITLFMITNLRNF